MVNDQEPRYRLVDSNGNVVGSLFQNADGNVEIQDETGTGSVFGPDGIVTPAIDAESVSAEVLNSDWIVDAGDHDSIQAALNHASNEEIGLVVIPPGDYDESDIQVPRGMRLSGVSPDSGEPGFSGTSIKAEDDNNPLLDLDSRSATIQHLSLVADGAGGAVSISASDCRMTGCNFRDGEISVTADGDRARIIDNTSNGQDIDISADDCVVIGNTRIGTVDDSGSGNEVANNT